MIQWKQAWRALRGRNYQQDIDKLNTELAIADNRRQIAINNFEQQKKRADLAAKMVKDSEAGQRAASDALGQKIISDLKVQS